MATAIPSSFPQTFSAIAIIEEKPAGDFAVRSAPDAGWLVATGDCHQNYRDGRVIIEQAKDRLAEPLGPRLN